MDREPRNQHEDSGYLSPGYLSPAADELQEEPETNPTEVSGIATSAAVEEESGSEPEPGAAAAATAGEQGQLGAGAPDPVVDEIQKGGGGGGADGDEEEFPQEPMQAPGDAEDPQPSDRQPRFHRCSFRQLQLKDLESVFQRSQYPNVFARKELAIPIDESETEVQFSKPENNDL